MSDARKGMAARLIRRAEGCRLRPYRDSAGVWTIGVGCTVLAGNPVAEDTGPITLGQADAALEHDMAGAAAAVDRYATVDLSDGEWAALVSFTFNLGTGAFRGSTLLRKLNANDRVGAASQFPEWCHAGGRVVQGLVNRRELERSVFLGQIPA